MPTSLKILNDAVLITDTKSDFTVLNFPQFISGYLNKNTTLKVGEIETFIEKYWGSDFMKRLKFMKKYKELENDSLKEITKKRKLGEGSYASVYQYSPKIAVKVVGSDATAKHEVEINKLLQEQLLFSKLTPCIQMIFQKSRVQKNDYIVIEKGCQNLWDYISTNGNTNTIKAIILQTIFTLAVIQEKFPGFRHNDLKCDNLLLDTKNKEDYYFYFGESKWKIPSGVPLVKFSDFDFANIKGVCENPKTKTKFSKSFGCTNTPNKIYDVHLFLYTIYIRKKYLHNVITNWICEIIPNELLKESSELKYSRLINPEKYTKKIPTPKKILQDPFFNCFSIKRLPKNYWGV